MLYKSLIILPLVGVVLSVGLWLASYWPMWYCKPGVYCCGWANGTVFLDNEGKSASTQGWHRLGTSNFITNWLAGIQVAPRTGPVRQRYVYTQGGGLVVMPLWVPTLVSLATGLALRRPLRNIRRRNREKLGLCVHCGYRLEGLTEARCPECNTPF